MPGFKSKVDLHTLVAAFGGSSCVVLQFPLLGISGRDVEESGVVLHGKMDGTTPFGVGAGDGTGAIIGMAVHEGAAELGTALGKFHTVMAHFKAGHTDRYAVRANEEVILVFELYASLFIEVNKGHNA